MRHADTPCTTRSRRQHDLDVPAGAHHDSAKRLALINDLRRASTGRAAQIEMHYQPQLCLKTGDIAASRRCCVAHPTHGLGQTPRS